MVHRVQVSIPYYTAMPEDCVTNTFHFQWLGGLGNPTSTDLDNLADNVQAWYENTYQTTSGISMAAWMAPNITSFKIYNLTDPEPRVPVLSETRSLTVTKDASSSYYPPEMSIVNSYHGAYVSGSPRASQRGRIYIGGIGVAGLTAGSSNTFPRVSSTLATAMGGRLKLLITSNLLDEWGWIVYSRKLDEGFPVVGGWVDDALDTQRRRGNKAQSRYLWS